MKGPAEFQAANTATAHYVRADLKADDFDHPLWRTATPIQISQYWSAAAAPKGRQAEARILWSDQALSVRFVCNQAEPLIVSPTPQTQKKTMGLWDRDVCEIFLAPDPNVPERYFEFEAAPTGEWIDLAIHWAAEKRETDWEFHSDMSAAARLTPSRLSQKKPIDYEQVVIALRIPWDDWIHKPQQGERWRANLFRCVGSGETRGYLAWQPSLTPQPSFHVPKAFGWLRFT